MYWKCVFSVYDQYSVCVCVCVCFISPFKSIKQHKTSYVLLCALLSGGTEVP